MLSGLTRNPIDKAEGGMYSCLENLSELTILPQDEDIHIREVLIRQQVKCNKKLSKEYEYLSAFVTTVKIE